MKIYQTEFDRSHAGYTQPDQKVTILVRTDVPFDDEHLDEFVQLFSDELLRLFPDWGCGLPVVDGKGWSTACGAHKIKLVQLTGHERLCKHCGKIFTTILCPCTINRIKI